MHNIVEYDEDEMGGTFCEEQNNNFTHNMYVY